MSKKIQDWIPQKVIRAVKDKGGSLEHLSVNLGLKPDSLRNALYHHCPRYERVIAGFLNISVEEIWPSRYQVK